jgi:cardiolipin synthase A/B
LLWEVLWILVVALSIVSAGHALLHKRDPRAALAWIVLCLILPGIGAAFYWLLGVNRIKTRARSWQEEGRTFFWQDSGISDHGTSPVDVLPRKQLLSLRRLSDTVTRRPLTAGNLIEVLHNGEESYPAMLEAIAQARRSVYLCTYIFDSDDTGRRFADALRQAADRGIEVRLIIDALGERYSFPAARRFLKGSKVKVARFLPLLTGGLHLNLRNHRKLLVVDNTIGFTGGMNIGDRHLAAGDDPRRVIDIHFRICGPVVSHLQEAFLEDWHFCTREARPPDPPPLPIEGGALVRGISVGPNEDYENLTWILIGMLNCARKKVRIMTPYFIPDRSLVFAINAASLRGVEVEIVLPEKNNLPYLAWATRSYLWELLRYGTRIYFQPPPFVHSKIMMMDGHYALIGSANLDPRSLRLNFEFNLEVYDGAFTAILGSHFDAVRSRSRETTLAEVDSRPLPIKLRDAFAKLFSPYL